MILRGNRFSKIWHERPLTVLLFTALFIRLIAAIFSEGYAFHDDHFCVTRVAQNWADGIPQWLDAEQPPKHSMVYVSINAVFMWLMGSLGITDTIVKTSALRILHAFYSILTVYFAFKITLLISNKKNALRVGWILALLWFMPYMSVKFLAELVCVPPLLAGFYMVLKNSRSGRNEYLKWFFAGALFGLSFLFRMHTILFAGGLGVVMLFQKRWTQSLLFSLGYLLVVFVFIGIPDMIFFDYPFQYIVNYFIFNTDTAYTMVTGSPLKFLLTTLGFLVPPVSVFLLWGYLKSWKVEPMLFWAITVFFVAHSLFPHQQERFILPMYPLLIILGVIGWNSFVAHSRFWSRNQRLHAGLWRFFWISNIIAALALALTFTKKDRVEPFYYLSKKKDVTSIIVESERGSPKQAPVYYLGGMCADYDEFENNRIGMKTFKATGQYVDPKFVMVFNFGADKPVEKLQAEMTSVQKEANYIIFKGRNNFAQRLERVGKLFPGRKLILEKEINPSNFDKLLHFLNPGVHRDDVALIYKIN